MTVEASTPSFPPSVQQKAKLLDSQKKNKSNFNCKWLFVWSHFVPAVFTCDRMNPYFQLWLCPSPIINLLLWLVKLIQNSASLLLISLSSSRCWKQAFVCLLVVDIAKVWCALVVFYIRILSWTENNYVWPLAVKSMPLGCKCNCPLLSLLLVCLIKILY